MKQLFFSLFVSFILFSFVSGDVVNYLYNPACSTAAGGCDFISPTNWNGTLSNNAQVYITSTESITLFLSNTSLFLSSLSFGNSGSSVNIVLSSSSLSLTLNNSTLAGNKNVMIWGSNSSLVLKGSTISAYSIQGGSLSLYNNSKAGAQFIVSNNLYSESNSFLNAIWCTINNGISVDSFLFCFVKATNFNATNTQFSGDLTVSGYVGIAFSTFSKISSTITLSNNSRVNFTNTQLNIDSLYLDSAIFEYYSSDASKKLFVAFVTNLYSGNNSVLTVGDNVVANIKSGFITRLAYGANVNITLGNTASDRVNVYSFAPLSLSPPPIASISIFAKTYFTTTNLIPLIANIYLNTQAQLKMEEMELGDKSSISGPGQFVVSGVVILLDNIITPHSLVLESESRLVVDTLTTSSISAFPIPSSSSFANASIFGDVVITSNGSLNIGQNVINVQGKLSQVGGYINFSINKTFDASIPNMLVKGAISLKNVSFVAAVGTAKEKSLSFLLMRSLTHEITLSESRFDNSFQTSSYDIKLSTDKKDGDLYLLVTKHGLAAAHKVIIIVSSISFVTVIGIIVGIFFFWRRRNQHKYELVK